MSKIDKSYLNIDVARVPGGAVAPAFLNYPSRGAFQLAHTFLYEQHHGRVRSPEHQHAVYHLVIFEEADNIFLLNGRKERSMRGTCVCCPPRMRHCFLPRVQGTTVYHALTFAFEKMNAPPSWAAILGYYTGRPVGEVPVLCTIPESKLLNLGPVWAGFRQAVLPVSYASGQQIHYGVLQWFAYLADLFDERRPVEEAAKRRCPAARARDYLDANYMGVADQREVARQIGVTPSHLNRVFSREYGITPGGYRESLRMEAAASLLRRSDLLIKEIAFRLGYADHFTFSKAFHRHYQCSPRTFRSR